MDGSEGFSINGSFMLYHYSDLVMRSILVAFVVYHASFSTSNQRMFSGLQFGVLAGLLTYTYLEPLFVPVGNEVAKVGLNVLTVYASLIGISLGISLPSILPGVTFGSLMTIFVGTFVTSGSAVSFSKLFFPIVGGVFSILSGLISAHFCSSVMVTLSTALEGGAIVSCIILKDKMLPNIKNVIRGYTLYPKHVDESDAFSAIGLSAEFMMEALWVLTSTLIIIAIIKRDGNLKSIGDISNFIPFGNRGYEVIPSNEKSADKASNSASVKSKNNKRTITGGGANKAIRDPTGGGPAPDGYNLFDPADLPARLAEYANMVYSACEDLGNFFGFQDSSVRNQAEHLLILLSNNRRYMSAHIVPPQSQPPSPIHALHAKVFSNYVQWCRAMNVVPNFSQISTSTTAPPAVASRVVDLVLYFCIWGEAGNIRHLPECLCFLYHKTMEEYIMNPGYTEARSLYAGHFLENTVTPIYNVLATNMKSKKDHVEKRNYDDFNEFFWSRNCLKYHYSSQDPNEQVDIEGTAGGGIIGPLPGEFMPPLDEGLLSTPKTFLEKRSWLRGILALNRILEWHIVTFYLLAVVAFSSELVWGWVYSIQIASFVFWILNALHLTWALLEVWGSYPGIQLSGTEVCGSIFILVARFLTLVYQSLYIMWAFAPQKGVYLGIEADSTFWWWQYIWLSLLVMTPYFVEAILQICPEVTSWVCICQNDFVQAFLNMLYPLSRLYVGKEVKESVTNTLVYMFFWVTLMCWKLYFSYIFEVYSMVLPSLELVDDYANYPNQSFLEMFTLLTMRWLPQFLVYIIDMSIWYAAWQAFAGTSVGFSEHLGDIRSIEDIRMNFGRAPEFFCKKMLSPDAGSRRGSAASFASSNSLLNNSAKGAGYSSGGTPIANERSSLMNNIQNRLNRLLDVRIQKWVMFSAAWNEIIDHLRVEDLLSNEECDNLKFSQFHGFSQAIYLPAFQTAGVIDEVITVVERPIEDYADPKSGEVTDENLFQPIGEIMHTAISEAWELGSFLLVQLLGPIHLEDVNAIGKLIDEWKNDGTLSTHVKVERISSVMKHVIAVISTLHQGIKKRKPALKPRGSLRKMKETTKPREMEKKNNRKGFRRVVSAGSLTSLSIDNDGKKYNKMNKNMDSLGADKIVQSHNFPAIDALRDQVRDKLRNMTQAMKPLLKNFEEDDKSRNVLDRLTFLGSMENGFFWNDDYASDQLDSVSKNATFKAVLKKMHGLVCLHPDDVIPKSKEVTRRLTFFTNSLFMDMPDAPSIHDMFSWNVLTPYYSEDVTYSKRDLEKRSDALGVSTLLYLQTLYRGDWNNFLERMGVEDDAEIWSKKNVDETRRWASIRAQTLSRTVNGMMYCEKALRLLANMERLDEETTNDLMGEKFGYIVACQVYGNMKKNQDSKADDIEALMHRFPLLRIAYIDNVRINRAGASIFFSVLVKSDRKGGVQEIYRVRLPGNAILGEGKPENQNHAMIFTRGEYLQTIDMNQEGYFEEALKMRNVLQEFAKKEKGQLPTTILGLREHIFTGSVSSLANYMALQEISFVTLGQRVLAKPLRIRLHYGHPDLFDKLFFITRGGISKSSKGINLSEDIFAGYNNVIRGGSCGFKEYVQVGKGRDVGMSQIYKFEAKLSQGNAEQSLSRDVYRMCHRLDFFRLFSYYYGGIGHYFSNVLTIFTVYIVVYLLALLAVYDSEKIGDRLITPMGDIQMLLGGLGLLQTIPLFATLGVERGWWESIQEIFFVFVTGGPFHFMFHIRTKAQYMAQTILVGGAKYRPTGRGFVTQHTPFDEQFRFFASSHMYMGIELAAGLILLGIYTKAGQYPGRTWSLWLASISFLWSPFWFNPLSFDWNVVVSDYGIWLRWMQGTAGGSAKSWSIWWTEENAFYKSMAMPSKCVFLLKAVLYALIAEGILRSDLFRSDISLYVPAIAVSKVLAFIVVIFLLSRFFNYNERSMPYPVRRTIGIMIFIALVLGVLTLFIEDKNFIRFALSAYYGIGSLCMVGLLFNVKSVKIFYMIHDLVVGHIIFTILIFFSALQFFGKIQTWLLYHNALSTDVVVGDILRYARKTQDSGSGSDSNNEDLVDQITELRKIVQRQEQSLANAGIIHSNENVDLPVAATSAVSQILKARSNAPQPQIRRPVAQDRSGFNRTKSLSGIDVWGDMALGNTNDGTMLAGDGSESASRAPPNNSASNYQDGGFSFTQPDVMPPR